MTHDIQLAGSGSGSMPGELTCPGGAQEASAASRLRKIHRLLRGRYPIVIALAVLGAVAGGVLGFSSQRPSYRSDGLIQIKPNIPDLTDVDRVMPMYTSYVESQAELVKNQRVVMAAIEDDAWRSTGRGSNPEMLAQFTRQLDVEYLKGTFWIRVSYIDADPGVARQAVRAVITAYKQLFYDLDTQETRETLATLDSRHTTLSAQLRAAKEQILALGQRFGTIDLDILHNEKLKQVVDIESQLNQAEFILAAARGALSLGGNGVIDVDAERIAETDHMMGSLLQNRLELEMQYQKFKQSMGPANPRIQELLNQLKALNAQISLRVSRYRRQPVASQISPDGTTNIPVTSEAVNQLGNRVNYLRKLYERERAATVDIGQVCVKIRSLQNDVETLTQQLAETNKAIDRLNVETVLSGKLQVLSYGDDPVSPWIDRRKQMAVLGFVGGVRFRCCCSFSSACWTSGFVIPTTPMPTSTAWRYWAFCPTCLTDRPIRSRRALPPIACIRSARCCRSTAVKTTTGFSPSPAPRPATARRV